FFHRVTNLALSEDKRRIARVDMEQQVDLVEGDEYLPLTDVGDGRQGWPAEPLWKQIDPGQAAEIARDKIDLEDAWSTWRGKEQPLVIGEHDVVVLGISVGALRFICKELIDDPENALFADMQRGIATTATQAMQLWMEPSKLGWPARVVVPYV